MRSNISKVTILNQRIIFHFIHVIPVEVNAIDLDTMEPQLWPSMKPIIIPIEIHHLSDYPTQRAPSATLNHPAARVETGLSLVRQ